MKQALLRIVTGCLWFVPQAGLAADKPIVFARDVAPIFEAHCIKCHAPDNKQGEISLATIKDLKQQKHIVAGDPDASHLLELITASGTKRPQMPKRGVPLSAQHVALIRRWIAEGARWPDEVVVRRQVRADASWWSLQRLADAPPPSPAELPVAWRQNPIDRFVFARLQAAELEPSSAADRRTLIRRATYDLTGLPPSPEQVAAFVRDPDPRAYELLIERLLASPHYGERWGRHWLDVIRFGESNGYERNVIIDDLWPFRDYVIRSFNEDKPFDQLVVEHLAGDVIRPNQPETVIGSAFLVCGPYDNVGNNDPVQAAQIRANTIDEIVRATAESFLGLTVGCARCHDHKFDPISQQDYYALYATFSGVRHGSRTVATAEQRSAHEQQTAPLKQRIAELQKQREMLWKTIDKRAQSRADTFANRWTREPSNRQGNVETFPPIVARFVKLTSEGQDPDPANVTSFGIDEFEVWSAAAIPDNVALHSNGGRASGPSRIIEDFPGAYGPQLTIDGQSGARFLATAGWLMIALPEPTWVNRVVFSSARNAANPEHRTFAFVADYRIEISHNGTDWTEVAHGRDRKPVNAAHRVHRLRNLETTTEEQSQLRKISQQLHEVEQRLQAIPALQTLWVGTRQADGVAGPFHVFVGGNPQKPGDAVVPGSLGALSNAMPKYRLDGQTDESERRRALAHWITDPENPLTSRVLANRLWHYHFGTGLVDTPSDFGFMGGQPTHPALLDWLARQLLQSGWRIKPLHRLIMTSQTYRQSSHFRAAPAQHDGGSRLLWRFPPRRLSAEEIRDTMLAVSGKLNTRRGGPGFRLYRYLQDNVATYIPLDKHGPDTFRRAVYHQNARAARTDLMTDFDQPDCAFSSPRRAETTTPLQALTTLNHQFTLDMARALATRLQTDAGPDAEAQVRRGYLLCYGRQPAAQELKDCVDLIKQHRLAAFCRVLLNTSELIYLP